MTMTAIPFARLVRKMRALHRICYSTPIDVDDATASLIEDAREAERAVDRAVRDILGQPTLFDRDDEVLPPH